MARALLVSSRVSVTPRLGAMWVSHVSGVALVGDVDGRCCFWVWVRVQGVFALLWVLLAGCPAGPGDDHHPLVLSVLAGRSRRRVILLVGLPRVLLQGLGVGEV